MILTSKNALTSRKALAGVEKCKNHFISYNLLTQFLSQKYALVAHVQYIYGFTMLHFEEIKTFFWASFRPKVSLFN